MLGREADEYTKTQDEYINILLAGIDFGRNGYSGSFSCSKRTLEDCHTDAMLVLSVNQTSGCVNLISLPRDLTTYVPGVYGLYKLNGAVNCGETMEQGLQRACEAVSWLLGGVQVSRYCAVDMKTMIALGDAIGGVEFQMDMAYTGSSGRNYLNGYQTLDGMGILDYLRARTNATRDGTDLGRTGRQRELMIALFAKVKENPELVTEILDIFKDPAHNLFTNLSVPDILSLASAGLSLDENEIGSHVLSGSYVPILGWNFTLIDQQHRIDVLEEVFSIEAQPLPFADWDFFAWLEEKGMTSVRYIGAARQLLERLDGAALTPQQEEKAQALRMELDRQIGLFTLVASTREYHAQVNMEHSRAVLRDLGEALMQELGMDAQEGGFRMAERWYEDNRINEYQFFWQ